MGDFRAGLRDFELSITVKGSHEGFQSCPERFQNSLVRFQSYPLQWRVHKGDFRDVLRDYRAVYYSGGYNGRFQSFLLCVAVPV